MMRGGSVIRQGLAKLGLLLLGSLSLWGGLSDCARAGVTFGGHGGYALGTLSRQSDESIKGYPVQGFLGYALGRFALHGYFQTVSLGYEVAGEVYSGTYSSFGVGAKFAPLTFKNSRLAIVAQYPLSGDYVVVSKTEGSVQGQSFKYSTLTSLEASSGFQVQIGHEFLSLGRHNDRIGGRSYLGLYVSYLSQSFDTQTTRIKTNNSTVAPVSPGREKVSYSALLIWPSITFTFEFI